MSNRFRFPCIILLGTAIFAVACESPESTPATLASAFKGDFFVGAALNEAQFSGRAEDDAAIVRTHFNTITAENVLKWEVVHPEPDSFDFGPADQFVSFGKKHDMFIVGHTLVWHSQTPSWVFEDASGNPAGRDFLLERLRDHIHTVVGRYKGRIDGWDVVNEALNEDGTLRETPWMQIIGADYLVKAFQFAREADPEAQLYYNDYSLPNAAKRDGAVALVKNLQAQGVTVDGIGMQGHYNLTFPRTAQLDSSIVAFSALGVDVMITELDIDVLPPAWGIPTADIAQSAALRAELNPYVDGLPDSVQQALAQRYADLFAVFLNNKDGVTRVTFWGVTDASSWRNNWPVVGRMSYPLLFDRAGQAKLAFTAVIEAAR